MAEKRPELIPRRLAYPMTFLALVFSWLAILWPVPKGLFWQSDTFWLIEVGRNILQSHRLPQVDPYSFTSQKDLWIVYQWLTEVAFAMANSQLALLGVALLGAVVLAYLLCVLIFRRMLKVGSNPFAAFITILLVFHSTHPEISSIRPQLFSFVFAFILQCMLEDVWTSSQKQNILVLLGKVFLLSVFWTNCHVSFPLGLCMLFLYLCAAAANKFVSRQKEPSRIPVLASMTSMFAFGTLLNPYGIELWHFALKLNQLYPSAESQPLNWFAMGAYGVAYCLFLLSALCTWKRVAFPRLLLALALFIAGCLHARFMIYFCISTSPLVAQALTQLLTKRTNSVLQSIGKRVSEVAFSKIYPVAVVSLACLVVCMQPLYAGMRPLPVEAAEYLNSHQPSGNMFCSADAGSYLIYRLRGSVRVFIDPRLDLYDPSFVREYAAAMMAQDWKSIFAKYDIGEALIPNDTKIAQAIDKDKDWEMIYKDAQYRIVRRSSSQR